MDGTLQDVLGALLGASPPIAAALVYLVRRIDAVSALLREEHRMIRYRLRQIETVVKIPHIGEGDSP